MKNPRKYHDIHPDFAKTFEQVKSYFFSRNPAYWPCFSDPGFKAIIDFRKLCISQGEQLERFPNGKALKETLNTGCDIPRAITPPTPDHPDELLCFAASLSKDWENPSSTENVITFPSDPALYGAMVGTLANPNLVYQEYSVMADDLEKYVIRQIAHLVGYDVYQATGLFTQGGTFCNLYGYLLGLRKSLPQAKVFGMGHIHDYRFINSHGGHYSNITNLSLLGVDVQKRTIRIKINERNDIDLKDLESQLHACFNLQCAVPTIMLTMGTTDTFAVDCVKLVYDLRNRLCEHYDIEVKPHIHVDSAIGWSLLFFKSYDFDRNPLCINQATLEGIQRNAERFKQLQYADSFTVDFQKWGYVPYTSSLVMIKNKSDMTYLENDPENFCYFEKDLQGHTHLQSTIECSRGAAGVFGAYAALKYMGYEGYQTVIAHCLQNANYFRHRLSELGYVKVLAPENQGPSVGFRIYNPEWVTDPDAEFDYEYRIQNTLEYKARLERNGNWHRQVFLNRSKIGLFTNWVTFIAHTGYDSKGRCHKLSGEKAVFMNPATTRKEIDIFIDHFIK